MKIKTMMLVLCVAAMWSIPAVQAQSPIAEADKATFLFDLRLQRMSEGELISSLGLAEMLTEQSTQAMDVDASKISRIFGAFELPDNAGEMAVFEGASPPEIFPMNFFARFQMADVAEADKFFASMTRMAEEVDIAGRKYFQDSDVMTNVLMYKLDDTTIEVGTSDFILAGTGKNVFSPGLLEAWSKVPNHSFRMAADLAGDAAAVSMLMEIAKQSNPEMDPISSAMLGLVDNASNMRFSLDLDSSPMLRLSATGVDSGQAEELRSGLDGALGVAKFGGKNALPSLGMDAETTSVLSELLDSLNATINGTEVDISVAKPSGFNQVVQTQVEGMKMMFAGPPGGFGPDEFGSDFKEAGSGFAEAGSGDAGSGEAGSGDAGSGDAGSGFVEAGSGEAGSGEAGSGEAGSGVEAGSGEAGSGEAGSGTADPFGGGEPAGGDPFGGGNEPAGGDPFGGGTEPAGGDPFGGGTEPAGNDPFGGGGTEPAGGDPFGGGTEPAGNDPFGGGTEPAGNDPFGGGSEPAGSDPFGGG